VYTFTKLNVWRIPTNGTAVYCVAVRHTFPAMTDKWTRSACERTTPNRPQLDLRPPLRGDSSTSIKGRWGPGVSEGSRPPGKIVGHMYKYAVFDIKPTYND